jgi:hypothetical protein
MAPPTLKRVHARASPALSRKRRSCVEAVAEVSMWGGDGMATLWHGVMGTYHSELGSLGVA